MLVCTVREVGRGYGEVKRGLDAKRRTKEAASFDLRLVLMMDGDRAEGRYIHSDVCGVCESD